MPDPFQQVRTRLVDTFGREKGLKVWGLGEEIEGEETRLEWYDKIIQASVEKDFTPLEQMINYKYRPVGLRTFIEDSFYLDKKGTVYPKVMEELLEVNSGKYVEAVFTGGIGSGKTFAAHYTIAYQIYLLSCMKNPHATFNLDPSSEILFVFQSISATHAKRLEFDRFRSLLSGSPYFKEVFPYDRDIESRLVFPNRIEVTPLSGQETAAIGQNVMGGVLDEVNYMAVVENSKAHVDGGTYDQAWALYNSIARRRKSRFIRGGKTYGMLCLVSSKRYPGQFTDIKENESKEQLATKGYSDIFIYDKRAWETAPEGTYSGEVFTIFIGDGFRKPRVIETEDDLAMYDPVKDRRYLMNIPIEYRSEFNKDIVNGLREVAGVSTLASNPFIMDVDAVTACFRGKSILESPTIEFTTEKVLIYKNRFKHKDEPRFVHIDLSRTQDHTGVVCGYVEKFIDIERGGAMETMPKINIDFSLEVIPPKNGEISYEKIRNILYTLKKLGLNIKWVTFDSYQSVDSIQILKSKGFITGYQSMDTSIVPYIFTKTAIYDKRLSIPPHPRLQRELLSLEKDNVKDKIDHPANGSKDVSDALAGVVYGLTMRREIWIRHGVSMKSIPQELLEKINKDRYENK